MRRYSRLQQESMWPRLQKQPVQTLYCLVNQFVPPEDWKHGSRPGNTLVVQFDWRSTCLSFLGARNSISISWSSIYLIHVRIAFRPVFFSSTRHRSCTLVLFSLVTPRGGSQITLYLSCHVPAGFFQRIFPEPSTVRS